MLQLQERGKEGRGSTSRGNNGWKISVSEKKQTKANKNKRGGPKCQSSEVFLNNSKRNGTSLSLEPSAHTIRCTLTATLIVLKHQFWKGMTNSTEQRKQFYRKNAVIWEWENNSHHQLKRPWLRQHRRDASLLLSQSGDLGGGNPRLPCALQHSQLQEVLSKAPFQCATSTEFSKLGPENSRVGSRADPYSDQAHLNVTDTLKMAKFALDDSLPN